jgi:hypothetical protein
MCQGWGPLDQRVQDNWRITTDVNAPDKRIFHVKKQFKCWLRSNENVYILME